MQHYSITVTGKVQGVFYRASTKDKAQELGITGWVKNMPDGSVHIEAEAEESVLTEFIEWCKLGPERALVELVKFEEKPLENFDSFKVKYW